VNTPELQIRQAAIEDLELLVPLFDAYRQFYRQPSEPGRARTFLLDRLGNGQSVVFLAFLDSLAVGFTQLYPSFSSGALAPISILNDLFVVPGVRRCGVGSALLQAAAAHGRRVGALRLILSTELANLAAQSLYERTGWKRDTVFCTYHLTL
jgi:GNAT superfamily N-acetyltransferase